MSGGRSALDMPAVTGGRDGMDDGAIARWRLRTLRLCGQPFTTPGAAVAGLLAVQAENYAQATWAIAARTSGVTQGALQQQFDDGVLLRTHVLRPTWHFVRPDDIRWLLELTVPRVNRLLRTLQRQLEMTAAQLEDAVAVVTASLAGGVHLTRAQLGERLHDAGLPTGGQRLGVLVTHAELSAVVCSGRMQGRQHTYALLAERAPAARRLDRAEALAELVLRYFTGHGPATERDLAYWASLTLADVRAGLAAVGDQLGRFEHDGRTYWFGRPARDDAPLDPRAHLLQVLDEYHNGYQDSRHVLDVDGLRPRGRGNMGMTLVDGQMVGGMRRSVTADSATFHVDLLRDLDGDEVAAVQAAADRYGRYLGVQAAAVLAPPHRRGT